MRKAALEETSSGRNKPPAGGWRTLGSRVRAGVGMGVGVGLQQRLGTQEPDPAGREAGRGEPGRGEPGARKAWPDQTVRARRAQRADPDATPGRAPRTRTAGAEGEAEGRGSPGTGHGFGNRRLGVLVAEVGQRMDHDTAAGTAERPVRRGRGVASAHAPWRREPHPVPPASTVHARGAALAGSTAGAPSKRALL